MNNKFKYDEASEPEKPFSILTDEQKAAMIIAIIGDLDANMPTIYRRDGEPQK